MTPVTTSPSALCRRLRTTLGFSQEELGWLLGVGERTVLRLEMEEPGAMNPTLLRLLFVLGETRLEDVEGVFRHCLLQGSDAEAASSDREATFSRAMMRLRGLELAPGLRLKDARVSRWVYWATGARADAEETLALARDEGVICRPLTGSSFGSLEQVLPGDHVLLCHDGEPQGWFELLRTSDELPEGSAREGLPPVFRVTPVSGALGRRLAKGGYPLWNGAPATGAKRAFFTSLAVRAVRRPLQAPAPRGRGIRDTITAFGRETPQPR